VVGEEGLFEALRLSEVGKIIDFDEKQPETFKIFNVSGCFQFYLIFKSFLYRPYLVYISN